jgi:hypothetical protein
MQHQPYPLDLADLTVESFETAALRPIITIPTLGDPTAETRCYYCPPASFDRACIETVINQ